MTRFLDGPAKGAVLWLKRSPMFLRAVQNAAGEWDALDQPEDTPEPGERISVYKREGEATWMHIRRSRSAGGSGMFWCGSYRLVDPQPNESDVRSTDAWRRWAVSMCSDLTVSR